MADLPCAMAADSLSKISEQMRQFKQIVADFPNVTNSFVFLGEEGEILGRIENDGGIISFYPNGAFFGNVVENWG